MKFSKTILAVLVSTMVLGACSSAKTPPSEPPTYNGSSPAITEGAYATYKTSRVFNAPLEPLRHYISEGNKIVSAMEEIDNIKKPVDVKVLSGTWPDTGAVRRLEFSDGHYTLERVIENDFPTVFRYQVRNFTSAAGDNLDYAVGDQVWEVLSTGQSKLTWTYALRPNAGYKRFLIQRFVDNDMQPLMNTALDKVQLQVNAAFAEER